MQQQAPLVTPVKARIRANINEAPLKISTKRKRNETSNDEKKEEVIRSSKNTDAIKENQINTKGTSQERRKSCVQKNK